jgi:EpsI family protein
LFWIGSFWREDDKKDAGGATGFQAGRHISASSASSHRGTAIAASGILAVAFVWPLFAAYLENSAPLDLSPEIKIANVSEKWRNGPGHVSDWKPIYVGATAELRQSYRHNTDSVDLYISYYRNQQQGTELISWQNVLVPESGSHWRHITEETKDVSIRSVQMVLKQHRLDSPSTKLLVWRWYWLGDHVTANPYLAKMILAKRKLLGRGDDGAEILVAAPYQDSPEEAVAVLRNFMSEMMPSITTALEHASNR